MYRNLAVDKARLVIAAAGRLVNGSARRFRVAQVGGEAECAVAGRIEVEPR